MDTSLTEASLLQAKPSFVQKAGASSAHPSVASSLNSQAIDFVSESSSDRCGSTAPKAEPPSDILAHDSEASNFQRFCLLLHEVCPKILAGIFLGSFLKKEGQVFFGVVCQRMAQQKL
jgi:hypothetical protein